MVNWKNIKKILIIDEDNTQMSPIAEFMLRDAVKNSLKPSIREISVKAMGIKRKSNEISNRAISYLQQNDYRTYDVYRVTIVTPFLALGYDLILCMNDYCLKKLKMSILFESLDKYEGKIFLFTEVVGLSGDINDPGDSYEKFYQEVEKIPPVIQRIIKELEKNN
jgi:protein-tyrosine-phosphatase